VAAGRSQLNINCSPELLARVKARARLEGLTLTELVVRLLEELVAEESSSVPLEARLSAIEARLSAVEQATGL
jgi:hypothetical protein